MALRNQDEDLLYCTPDEATLAQPELVASAATLNVELLYLMSGLETEEPTLQRGRINVLPGQGLIRAGAAQPVQAGIPGKPG